MEKTQNAGFIGFKTSYKDHPQPTNDNAQYDFI